jgi:hypothetical protein
MLCATTPNYGHFRGQRLHLHDCGLATAAGRAANKRQCRQSSASNPLVAEPSAPCMPQRTVIILTGSCLAPTCITDDNGLQLLSTQSQGLAKCGLVVIHVSNPMGGLCACFLVSLAGIMAACYVSPTVPAQSSRMLRRISHFQCPHLSRHSAPAVVARFHHLLLPAVSDMIPV